MEPSNTVVNKFKARIKPLLKLYNPHTWKEKGLPWTAGLALATYMVVVVILGILWSRTPSAFDVRDNAVAMAGGDEKKLVVRGYVTTATTVRIAETLLDKRGGYLSNDLFPPGLYLDNMPNWEFGVLTELRDTTRSLRNDFSRSQTQSVEDKDLAIAQPQFNYDSKSWMLPSSESEYRKGIKALRRYLERLTDDRKYDGQFFTRADNLGHYLQEVGKRLGDLAQRLAASVGEDRYDTTLAGDPKAEQSKPTGEMVRVRTPWLQIDDVFYEARGYTWALLQMLEAIRIDFEPVLKDKNAVISLRQIIRELRGAQDPMWSPMVLNGTGFGPLANHSLVMASYVSRANAALIDLRNLLQRG